MVRRRFAELCARPALAAVVCLGFASACGSSSGGGSPDANAGEVLRGLVSLTVSPADAVIIADGTTPGVQSYTAEGRFEDGTQRDVTGYVRFAVSDVAIGRFAESQFTTSNLQGGRTTVTATSGSVVGSASLTVVIRQRQGDPTANDLPADPGGPFGGPAVPARAPRLVYPANEVLLPPNLGRLEVHFYPGDSNTLFAIDFTSGVTDVTIYTRCVNPLNGGCIYRPTDQVWRWIASSNRGAIDGIKVAVRGTDNAGSGVGTSAPITVAFSEDDIQGGIYYWTTSSKSVMRFDFAGDQTEPEVFVDQRMTGYVSPTETDTPEKQAQVCGVGCHALSRDGKKLATAVGRGSFDARQLVIDVERRETRVFGPAVPRSAFFAWNPDATQYVGTFGTSTVVPGFLSFDLNLFNGDTGASEGPIAVGGIQTRPTAHPDWSPDGMRIAYTRGNRAADAPSTVRLTASSIGMVTRTGTTWGPPAELTTSVARTSTYYPAFSPAGDLMAFNRSTCTGAETDDRCDCYDDPNAALWIMRPEPGAPPVEMARANARGANDTAAYVQSSYPKWSPFTFQRTGEESSRLHWITFSSDRKYGLYTPPATQTLIWMAAVDPDAALGGRDPSFPAFALPFQDILTDNHTAQWAERVVPPVD